MSKVYNYNLIQPKLINSTSNIHSFWVLDGVIIVCNNKRQHVDVGACWFSDFEGTKKRDRKKMRSSWASNHIKCSWIAAYYACIWATCILMNQLNKEMDTIKKRRNTDEYKRGLYTTFPFYLIAFFFVSHSKRILCLDLFLSSIKKFHFFLFFFSRNSECDI